MKKDNLYGDYVNLVQQEISELHNSKVLQKAETVTISFNIPKEEIKEARDMMLHQNMQKPRFRSTSEFILNMFDAIMIIPIKNKKPIVIFKRLGKTFSNVSVTIDAPHFKDPEVKFCSYLIYWENKILNIWPKEALSQYGFSIRNMYFEDYSLMPENILEVSLKAFISNRDTLFKDKNFTPVKRYLRNLGILIEGRGKFPKKEAYQVYREEFIISKYQEIRKNGKERLPIKEMRNLWISEADRKYKSNKDYSKKYLEYCGSDQTIRRIINNFREIEKNVIGHSFKIPYIKK